MTYEEFTAQEAKGNYKRLGIVDGAGQVGRKLRVVCEGWEPWAGDMFSVIGLRSANPVTGLDTGMDTGLIVSRILESNGQAKTLELGCAILPDGPYRNVASLAANGAVIYQLAGEFLKEIHERWLETNV